MVLPLMAAQAAGDIAKKIGEQASVTVIDFIYQPMIKVGKGKKKKEIPDPHYPSGVRFALPAWFVALILAIGGTALLSVFIAGMIKGLEKKMDPLEVLKSMTSNPFKDLKMPWG